MLKIGSSGVSTFFLYTSLFIKPHKQKSNVVKSGDLGGQLMVLPRPIHQFFLSSEGVKPIENHRRMKVQYGDACLSLQQVYEWTGKFMNGISSVTESPRPGQAHRVVTPEAIAAFEAIVKENHRVTVNEITAHRGVIHGSAHQIVRDVLQFHKVSTKLRYK